MPDVVHDCERRWRREKMPFRAGFVAADVQQPLVQWVQLYGCDPARQKNEPRRCVPTGRAYLGPRSLDFVNCQYVLQYVFHNREVARAVLSSFRSRLDVNGRILITVPDGDELAARLNECSEIMVGESQLYRLPPGGQASPLSSYHYQVLATLPDGKITPLLDCKEAFVFRDDLLQTAADVGLVCVWDASFADIAAAAASQTGLPRAETLAKRMKIDLAECADPETLAELRLSRSYCFVAASDHAARRNLLSFLPTPFVNTGHPTGPAEFASR